LTRTTYLIVERRNKNMENKNKKKSTDHVLGKRQAKK
jgi:hypothetical protein